MELVDITGNIETLPRDERGYPVPWFVAWIDGKPQFPIMDGEKFVKAIKEQRCWICGGPMDKALKAFVAGPMCAINRTSAEPPSHLGCAEFAVKNCPFLVNPKMRRIENELTEKCSSAGVMIRRNPGVSLIWVTKGYEIFRDHRGGVLIDIGTPVSISAWHKGTRTYDKAIIEESVNSGLHELEKLCTSDKDKNALKLATNDMWQLLSEHNIA